MSGVDEDIAEIPSSWSDITCLRITVGAINETPTRQYAACYPDCFRSSCDLRRPARDSAGNSVLRYDEITGIFIDAFVPSGSGGLTSPQGLVFGPDGNLYVTNRVQINRYNGTTGALIDVFVPGGTGLVFARDLAFGPDGNLYAINSSVGNTVLRYNGITGAFVDAFVPPGGAGLRETRGLEFGPDGNLYVTDHDSGQVKRFDIGTGAFLGDFLSEAVFSPNDAVFGPDGNLYVLAVSSASSVLRFNGITGTFIDTFVDPGSGGAVNPQSLLFGPDGNLYVVSNCCVSPPLLGQNPNSVLRYNGTTGDFLDVFVPAGRGGLQSPVFLAFAPPSNGVPEPSSFILLTIGIFGLTASLGGLKWAFLPI